MPKALQKTKDPFLILTPAQASGERNTISVHSAASKVYTEHLVLNPGQKQSIDQLYSTPGYIQDIQYRSNSDEDQAAALATLCHLKLDTNSQETLDCRWSVHWTNSERKGKREIKRVLYQWYVS